jgi:ribosomal protein S27E
MVHPCAVCYYHVEDELHEGGSGSAALFLHNHYMLAICENCQNLVSVLVPNSDEETKVALRTAQNEIVQMEADLVVGDTRARDLLPFFRDALDRFHDDLPATHTQCNYCGSTHVEVQRVEQVRFDEQDAWVPCPRCEEGRLLVETAGRWD